MLQENCRKNQNTILMFNNFFFFENFAVYKTMWKNIVESGRPQMMCMRIACWIPKATDTHSEHVILIVFQPQQRLYERTSILRYTYIDCLVVLIK
jgi:hypothetical protein